MTRQRSAQESQLPSRERNDYWLYSRPPKRFSGEIDEGCVNWFSDHANEYVSSGSIYPRDIRKDNLVSPSDEPELTLMALDHEAVNQAKKFIASLHRSEDDVGKVMFFSSLTGKWLIYAPRFQIDGVWEKLSSAIGSGKLPYSAKVSTAKDNELSSEKDKHVICIYTPNYLFREDVRRCRALLSDLGFVDRLFYKPDIMTMKGMYRITGSRINHRYYG